MRKKRTKSKGVLSYKKKRTKTKAFSKKKRISKSNSQKKISRSKMKKTQTKKRIRSKRNKTNKRSKKKKRNVLLGGSSEDASDDAADDAAAKKETAAIQEAVQLRDAARAAAAAAVEEQDILPGAPSGGPPSGGPSRPQSNTPTTEPVESVETEPVAEPVTPEVDVGPVTPEEVELELDEGSVTPEEVEPDVGPEPEPEANKAEDDAYWIEKQRQEEEKKLLAEEQAAAEPGPESPFESEWDKVRASAEPVVEAEPSQKVGKPDIDAQAIPPRPQLRSSRRAELGTPPTQRPRSHNPIPHNKPSVNELKKTLTKLSNEYINEQYQIIYNNSSLDNKKEKLQEHNKQFIINWIDTVDVNPVYRKRGEDELNEHLRRVREKEIIEDQIAKIDAPTDKGDDKSVEESIGWRTRAKNTFTGWKNPLRRGRSVSPTEEAPAEEAPAEEASDEEASELDNETVSPEGVTLQVGGEEYGGRGE